MDFNYPIKQEPLSPRSPSTPREVPVKFDKDHFLLCAQDGDENIYSKSTTKGARKLMDDQLRALNMKTANLDNSERCRRLLIHYRNPNIANPQHYKTIPFQFITRSDFWITHSSLIAFLNKPNPRMIVIFIITYILHYYSYKLYVMDIEFGGYKYPSCALNPYGVFCKPLKTIQDYTFGGMDDLGKMFFTVGLNFLYSNIIPRPKG